MPMGLTFTASATLFVGTTSTTSCSVFRRIPIRTSTVSRRMRMRGTKPPNAVIEQNLCYNLQAQSLAEMGQGVMIENSKDLIIRNNVFKNYISVYASTTNERLKIYNNTFVSTLAIPPSGMFSSIYLTNSPGTSIKNNIFYDFPTDAITLFDGTSRQGLDVDHNVVYRSDGRRPTGSPYPNDLWGVNPKLADPANGNYKLTSGSPAIDSGRTLPDVSNDYNGATRPQGTGYDIGAFEYPQ